MQNYITHNLNYKGEKMEEEKLKNYSANENNEKWDKLIKRNKELY